MTTSAEPRRTAAGFTLSEAMVVVALVAILAALAAPSFHTQIANQRVSAAGQDLLGLLQFARAEAVYKRRPTHTESSGPKWEVTADNKVLREALLPDNVSVEAASKDGVSFDVTGAARVASGTTPYKVSLSSTHASRIECLSVMGAGLVKLQRVAAGADCP